ncbi:MAG: hypothetical protein ACR2N1_25525 [Rubripirellula sp.]
MVTLADEHPAKQNGSHVDVGNVSAIVFTGTPPNFDSPQDWSRSFTFRPTPMIVSDLVIPSRR